MSIYEFAHVSTYESAHECDSVRVLSCQADSLEEAVEKYRNAVLHESRDEIQSQALAAVYCDGQQIHVEELEGPLATKSPTPSQTTTLVVKMHGGTVEAAYADGPADFALIFLEDAKYRAEAEPEFYVQSGPLEGQIIYTSIVVQGHAGQDLIAPVIEADDLRNKYYSQLR